METKTRSILNGITDPAPDVNKRLGLHRWVLWTAGYSAEFVKDILNRYVVAKKIKRASVLDPFSGVGTTLVESMRIGASVIGFEINPFAADVCKAKTGSNKVDIEKLVGMYDRYQKFMEKIEGVVDKRWENGFENGFPMPRASMPEFKGRLPLFSIPVENKILNTLDFINHISDDTIKRIFRVALGGVLVAVSNYSYAPSLTPRWNGDAPDRFPNSSLLKPMRVKLMEIIEDILRFRLELSALPNGPRAKVYCESFLGSRVNRLSESVDLVLTSPPYLNNYHYIRNTRPQLHILYGMTPQNGLKKLENENLGKYWQTVRSKPPSELSFQHEGLQHFIENLASMSRPDDPRIGQGWANYVTSYFNDSLTFFRNAKTIMRPKATCVVVVGNSIIQGREIRVDKILAEIAEMEGFQVQEVRIVRAKRQGSSIVNSNLKGRQRGEKKPLYEAGLVIRKNK